GKVESYVLPSNATLRSQSQVIGDTSAALFRQVGGVNAVDELSLGRRHGGQGTYEQHTGTVVASKEVIGDDGAGTFIQFDGVNIAKDTVVVGGHPNSVGATLVAQTGTANTFIASRGGAETPAKTVATASSSD